jgi:hypothetical protein
MNFTALCESSRQVRWLIRNREYSGKINQWIAANPSAYWELSQRKIPFSTLEEFQKNRSMHEVESLLQQQTDWSKRVDTVLQESNSDFENTNFCPAQNYLYYLKITWDLLINRADLLESVKNNIITDNLIFFRNPHQLYYSEDLTMSGSALSECIPIWADHYNIRYTPLPVLDEDNIWQPQKPTGIRGKIIAKVPRAIIGRVQSILHNPHLAHFPPVIRHTGVHGKIIVRTAYDVVPEISRLLIKRGYDPIPFDDDVRRSKRYTGDLTLPDQSLTESWHKVHGLDWFWKPGGWQDWSLRHSLEPLFHHFWSRTIPGLWNSFNGSSRLMKKQSPLAVCVPSIWNLDETGFIMAAHSQNVPVIFYQHGACMGDIENTTWDHNDSYYGNYQLVYGEGAASYLRSRSTRDEIPAVPIPVGSSRLDGVGLGVPEKRVHTLRRNILKTGDRPLVVYVPGIISNNYFRYDYQDFRNCRIFDIRTRLAEFFNDHRDIQFAYKPFISQGHDPTLEMLSKTCPACSIIDSIPLTELQWIADLIIHEVPSTGMYEGLVTDRPMIVYVDRDIYRMSDDVKNLLRKRAEIAETGQDLVDRVRQFIFRGNFSPIVTPDREFVKAFCTHLDDGRSAIRATDVIEDIIKKWPKNTDISSVNK